MKRPTMLFNGHKLGKYGWVEVHGIINDRGVWLDPRKGHAQYHFGSLEGDAFYLPERWKRFMMRSIKHLVPDMHRYRFNCLIKEEKKAIHKWSETLRNSTKNLLLAQRRKHRFENLRRSLYA